MSSPKKGLSGREDQPRSSNANSGRELSVQKSPFMKRREMELQKQVMPLRHLVSAPARPDLNEDKVVADKSLKEEEEIERQKMQ